MQASVDAAGDRSHLAEDEHAVSTEVKPDHGYEHLGLKSALYMPDPSVFHMQERR